MTIHSRPFPTAAAGGGPPGVVNDWGFNWRASDIVVDAPNEIRVDANPSAFNHPSQFIKDNLDPLLDAGWIVGGAIVSNRSANPDRRLAGIAYTGVDNSVWRVDVANGQVRISLAAGDYSDFQTHVFELWDGAVGTGTLLDTYAGTTQVQQWIAADGVIYDEAGWVTANDALTARMTYTVTNGFVSLLWASASSGNNTFCHLRVEELS